MCPILSQQLSVQHKLVILDDNLKNKEEPIASTHSAPHSAVRFFLLLFVRVLTVEFGWVVVVQTNNRVEANWNKILLRLVLSPKWEKHAKNIYFYKDLLSWLFCHFKVTKSLLIGFTPIFMSSSGFELDFTGYGACTTLDLGQYNFRGNALVQRTDDI